MRSGERELSIAFMIENPAIPSIWRVAPYAIAANTALMVVVGMAGLATLGCFLISLRAMAGRAAHGGVKPNEWKARQIMVESHFRMPRSFVMALGAIRSQ